MLQWRAIHQTLGPREILSGVDLSVHRGEVVCLVGPSGCGKTTLLSLAAGLLEPTGGQVVNGFRRTACVFQEPRLLPWRRTLDNAAFGLRAHGVPRRRRRPRAFRLLRRLGLARDDVRKFPHELSGGMRQRAALARALAVDPDLLLMDEPFSALDVGLRRDLQALLARTVAERELSALFITHDLDEAARLADRIVVMAPAPGRIVVTHAPDTPRAARTESAVAATVRALLATPAVARAFGAEETPS